MSVQQMAVFNKYVMPATIETLNQMVQVFNQSSGGAITLTTEGFSGDFLQRSFFQGLHNAQRRVDRYAANAVVAPTDLAQLKESGVKVAGGFGPVQFEPAQLTWLLKPTREGIEVISRNIAEALLADQLNTSINCLVAALENQADAVNDVSGTGALTYDAINGANAKFGDASSKLVANVMTGAMKHRLIGANLGNAERLFQSGNVQIINILGQVIIVTDAPALYEAGTPNKDKVLSLVANAAMVYDSSDVIPNVSTTNGKERIETTMQVDYTFGVSINGHTWDETAGGKSPSDAALGTGTNWPRTSTTPDAVKRGAGVLAIGNAA